MAPGKQQIFQACLRNDGIPKRMPRISLKIFPSTKHRLGKAVVTFLNSVTKYLMYQLYLGS